MELSAIDNPVVSAAIHSPTLAEIACTPNSAARRVLVEELPLVPATHLTVANPIHGNLAKMPTRATSLLECNAAINRISELHISVCWLRRLLSKSQVGDLYL